MFFRSRYSGLSLGGAIILITLRILLRTDVIDKAADKIEETHQLSRLENTVTAVQEAEFVEGISYEEAMSRYLNKPEWDEGIYYDHVGIICSGRERKERNAEICLYIYANADSQKFEVTLIEFNGKERTGKGMEIFVRKMKEYVIANPVPEKTAETTNEPSENTEEQAAT